MNMEKTWMALFVAIVMFTGFMSIHQDLNKRHGVTNEHTLSVQEEFDEMKNTVKSDSNETKGIYEKIKTISRPTEDIFATAAAGLTIAPQFMGLMLAPVQIVYDIIDSVQKSVPSIPSYFFEAIKILFTLGLAVGGIALLVRWKP